MLREFVCFVDLLFASNADESLGDYIVLNLAQTKDGIDNAEKDGEVISLTLNHIGPEIGLIR